MFYCNSTFCVSLQKLEISAKISFIALLIFSRIILKFFFEFLENFEVQLQETLFPLSSLYFNLAPISRASL